MSDCGDEILGVAHRRHQLLLGDGAAIGRGGRDRRGAIALREGRHGACDSQKRQPPGQVSDACFPVLPCIRPFTGAKQ